LLISQPFASIFPFYCHGFRDLARTRCRIAATANQAQQPRIFEMLSMKAAAMLLLCAMAFFTTAASARPAGSHAGLSRHRARHAEPTDVSARRRDRAPAESAESSAGGAPMFGGGVVDEARRWIGTNPTGRSSLWCAAFMNFVLERSGHKGSGSNMARSFASYGSRIAGPQVGAIAVMSRGGGGHVGVVSGIDANGNPIIISGNHGRRVAEATYPRGRVYAYVMP
jgi:uncharacterized protein (TIGR02594 family)